MNDQSTITIAPLLSDAKCLIIYRQSGEEVIVVINDKNNEIKSKIKLTLDEVNFIRENYL
jgi:hypothetical protein